MLASANELDEKTVPMLIKSMTAFIEALKAKGLYTFTQAEAMNTDKRSDIALEAALRRLKQKGRIANPHRGFYVIVPVEYRETGCPPASWFIDALMRFLRQPYYVGILSAAAIHGAAHQQPMLFQVEKRRPIRSAVARYTQRDRRGGILIPRAQVTA